MNRARLSVFSGSSLTAVIWNSGVDVAEADHRLVAHLQDRRRRVLGAGGRERPRQLEVVTADAAGFQRLERLLHRLAARLRSRRSRSSAGRGTRRTRVTRRSVARPLVLQTRRPTAYVVAGSRLTAGWITSSRSVGSSASGVGLGPQRHPLTGRGVDEHDGRVVVERRAEVGPRRQVRRVEIGHVGEQRRVGAEAVVGRSMRAGSTVTPAHWSGAPRRDAPPDARSASPRRRRGTRRSGTAGRTAACRADRTRPARRRAPPRSPRRSPRRPVWTASSVVWSRAGSRRRWSVAAGPSVAAHRMASVGGRIVRGGHVVSWRAGGQRWFRAVVPAPAARCDDQRRGDAESGSFPHRIRTGTPASVSRRLRTRKCDVRAIRRSYR